MRRTAKSVLIASSVDAQFIGIGGTVAKSSVKCLVGCEFASLYRIQTHREFLFIFKV